MSDVDKWLGIIGGVADTNIGRREKGPSRSRRRNQALLGVVGELWRDYEVDKLNQKVDNANIENLFEVARARKDLIQAKKINKKAEDLKALAAPGTDFNNMQDIDRVYGNTAWTRALSTNDNIRSYIEANPDDDRYTSKASFNRYVDQISNKDDTDSSLRKLQTSLNNLYDSDLRSIQNTILGGEATTVDEVEPYIRQAQQMKINFDSSETSLLDILSGRVKRNIARQDQTYDRFRTEFISQPQMQARKAIADLSKTNPNDKQAMQEAFAAMPRNLRLEIPTEVISVINSSRYKKHFYNTLGVIAETMPQIDNEEWQGIVNNIVLGVATADPTEGQLHMGKIRESLKDKMSENEYNFVVPMLDNLAITSSVADLNNRANQYATDARSRIDQKAVNTTLLENLKTSIDELYSDKNSKNYKAAMRAYTALFKKNNLTSRQINYGALTDHIQNVALSLKEDSGTPSDFREAMNYLTDQQQNFKTLVEAEEFINSSIEDPEKRYRYIEALNKTSKTSPALFKGYEMYPGNPDMQSYDPVKSSAEFNSKANFTEEYKANYSAVIDKNDEDRSKQARQKLGYFNATVDNLLFQDEYNNILGGKANKALLRDFQVDYLSNAENFYYDENAQEVVLRVGDDELVEAYKNYISELDGTSNDDFQLIGNQVLHTSSRKKQLSSAASPEEFLKLHNAWVNQTAVESPLAINMTKEVATEQLNYDFDELFDTLPSGELKLKAVKPPVPEPETTVIDDSVSQSERKPTPLDNRYQEALANLKEKAKYPNRFPRAYEKAVEKEASLRAETGTRYPRPDEYLDLQSDEIVVTPKRNTFDVEVKRNPSLLSKGSDTTRGVRNRNIFNIRNFNQNFNGEAGSDDDNFLKFESIALGVRAADRTLATYGKKHNIDTVEGVISRFAPEADNNDTSSYIATVSKQTGFKPKEKIDLDNPEVRAKLLAPMALVESKFRVTPNEILEILENV